MRAWRILLLAPLLAITSGALAQSPTGLDWLRIKYSTLFNREPFGWSQAQIERQFSKIFDGALLAGNETISVLDEKLAMDISLATLRANRMRQVLAADLNGDFKVTRDEVRASLRHKYARRTYRNREARMQREFDRIMRNDTSRDGTITLEEVRKSADVQSALRGSRRYSRVNSNLIPMSLDRNADKALSRVEFMFAVRKIFDEIDSDTNKVLSENEMLEFMRSIRKVRQRQAKARRKLYSARRMARSIMRCQMPDWPKSAKPVFASTYRGMALANVVFKGRQQLISVARIHIEEGPDNVALVLSAPANVIWQITGVKERVAKVYLGSRFGLGKNASVAVTGVDKGKVHFITRSGCLPYNFTSKAEQEQIDRSLQALTGISPLAVVSLRSKPMIAVPSGKTDPKLVNPQAVALPKGSPAGPLWSAVSRSFPAGIVRIAVKDVVAGMPVEKSKVFPGRAGLAQLIDQGALEIVASSVMPNVMTRFRFPVREMRILAPIRMPRGIGRNIVRKFVLAKNVAVPEGLHSRVCVVNEADGKPVAGSGRC